MSTPAGPGRRLLRSVSILVIALLAAYAIVSAYVASSVWHPVRHPLHTTPAAYGLSYEDVEFRSEGDGIPLRGWLMDAPGTETILAMHGSNSTRDNYIIMEVSRALVQLG
jgi:uncharacterized protein